MNTLHAFPNDGREEARDAARVALAGSAWYTLGAAPGGAREMTELAGLASAMRERGWGAAELRDVLDTGGEAHKAAAAAMAARQMEDDDGAGGGENARPPPKTDAQLSLERAQTYLDAVALGAEADVKRGWPMDWDGSREKIESCYRDAGLEDLAAFVGRYSLGE